MAAPIVLDDAYLSLRNLAAYSGLSERSLRGYLTHRSHPLPCYRIGGRVLVRRSDYDAWVERFKSVAPAVVDAMMRDMLRAG